MKQHEFYQAQELLEKVEYWEELVRDLKKWEEPMNAGRLRRDRYQNKYPTFAFNLQGYGGSTIVPTEALPILVKWAQDELLKAKNDFENFNLKENL